MNISNLAAEWSLLQNQFDSYEKYSLLIKLTSVFILSISLTFNIIHCCIMIIVMVLWLQDAIWKTFQSRIETRLLQVEEYISQGEGGELNGIAYQFNREYLSSRQGTSALIKEYLLQAIRPTIAFPHVVLVLVIIHNYFQG